MRSTPQVIGAAHDALAYARKQVEIELNGVGDNPIFLPENKTDPDRGQLPGLARLPAHGHDRRGRDHGLRPVRAPPQPADQSGPERRPAGLPDQGRRHVLGHDAQPVHGRHADRRAAHPLRAGLHPVHPGRRRPGGLRLHGHEHGPQERSRSWTTPTASWASNSWPPPRPWISASSPPGKGVETARAVIRKHVAHLDVDRPLYADHNTMKALVQSGEILDAVEKAVGPLG